MAVSLFPHNRTAYERVCAMLEKTGKAAVIHPTGTGKSFIGFQCAADHPETKVLWLAPSEYIFKTQMENWLSVGGDALPNITFLTYAKLSLMAEEEIKALTGKTAGTVLAVSAETEEPSLCLPTLIVLDEFHRAGAVQWGLGVQRLLAAYTGADSLKALIDEKFNNNVWNKLYRRKLFDGVLFPEGKNYEDVAVMHRIVDRASLVAVEPSVLYHYRIRSESITKTYTAKNLMDYADARLSRYNYFLDERPDLFAEKKEELLLLATNGISKVWRWWHGCKAEEKEQLNQKISSLRSFTKENIPLFGFRSWPFPMRLSAVFMHSRSAASFAVLYYLNQLFRRLWPEKGNVV